MLHHYVSSLQTACEKEKKKPALGQNPIKRSPCSSPATCLGCHHQTNSTMTTRAVLPVFAVYQKERVAFVTAVTEMAKKPPVSSWPAVEGLL